MYALNINEVVPFCSCLSLCKLFPCFRFQTVPFFVAVSLILHFMFMFCSFLYFPVGALILFFVSCLFVSMKNMCSFLYLPMAFMQCFWLFVLYGE